VKSVRKFRLDPSYKLQHVLKVPVGAQWLRFLMQGDTPCLWAIVDEDAPLEHALFFMYSTGDPLAEPYGMHVGTVGRAEGTCHLFCHGAIDEAAIGPGWLDEVTTPEPEPAPVGQWVHAQAPPELPPRAPPKVPKRKAERKKTKPKRKAKATR